MRIVVSVLAWAVLVGGCATPGPVAAPAVSVQDPGARARADALARYDRGPGGSPALATPDVLGLTPVDAAEALEDAGLSIRVVPHDRTQPVTNQFPAPGDPPGVDGTVEVWLGNPPPVGPDPTPSGEPSASPTPTPSPTADPTVADGPVVATVAGVTRYVLPPHTPGRLRINPRRLPAVPAGTELTGLASWYGPGFHGLTTACGGVYDQNGPTLATRELRCGTVVRVTGPTGLTVEATVTDWGPAEWAGRRFDLSAAVFNAIAPLSTGVIPVRVVTVNVPE